MQGSLFSSAIDKKETAISCLESFEYTKARELFAEAQAIDPFLAELDSFVEIANFLATRFKGDKPDLDAAIKALSWIRTNFENNGCNRFVFEYVEKLIGKLITPQFPPDFNAYITSEQIGFHIGYLYYVMEEFEIARKKLLDYVSTQEGRLHARLWGYLGDLNYLLKFHREAESAYMHAFFIDPMQVDLIKLKHPELLDNIKRTREKFESEAMALQYLPVACWMNHLFFIPRGPGFLTEFAEAKLTQRYEKQQRYHRFALCLLLDQAGVRDDMDFRAREEMQRIDPDLFQEYLERVSPC